MQISFCMACSMPLYPFRRKKKAGNWEMVCLIWSLLRNPDFVSSYTMSRPRGQSTVQGRIQAWEPRAASSVPSSPEHNCSVIQSHQNTKADWDFTVSTQNKWMRQKRAPVSECKSSALIRNGITRNAFLPWEESLGCRGKPGKRCYSLLVVSSWQVEASIITISHSCSQQKQFRSDGQKKPLKVNNVVSKHCRL